MADNIFKFPKGTEDLTARDEELQKTINGLLGNITENKENIRSLLYVTMYKDGTAHVAYGGEFATSDIVGILETIKMELVLRTIITTERD